MQRPQAAEVEPGRDVEPGKGELEGDVDAHRHARQAPEQSREGAEFDGPEIVVGLAVDLERGLDQVASIGLVTKQGSGRRKQD